MRKRVFMNHPRRKEWAEFSVQIGNTNLSLNSSSGLSDCYFLKKKKKRSKFTPETTLFLFPSPGNSCDNQELVSHLVISIK